MLVMEVSEFGSPDRLVAADRPVPQPGPGEVLVEHRAIGVNFVDLQHRAGKPFPTWGLPPVPGTEAAGVVAELGPGVTGLAAGDRVAYTGMPGVYAEYAALEADRVVPVPDDSTWKRPPVLLQGLTAQQRIAARYPMASAAEAHRAMEAGPAGKILLLP